MIMPNHVLNKVTISGSKSDVAKCKKQILNAYKGDNGETMNFSFNTIIPMPESLNIESSNIVEDAIKYINSNLEDIPNGWEKLSEDELERRTELGRKAIKNIELYEAKDWYDWRVKNWGTKWDCYETVVEDSECSIYLEFWTAWSSPYPVLKKLSEQHPSLSIEVQYADEDFGYNCGTYTLEEGEELGFVSGDYNFACSLWGCEPDEQGENNF